MFDKYSTSDNDDIEEKHDDDDDDDDVIMGDDNNESQTTHKQGRQVQAVEKGLNDEQLIPYFNRYILILQDEKQQTKRFTNEQLHDYLTSLFQSLEYSNEQPDGK
jgi:hypothetical protein